jgi:poly(A) polymerase
MSSRLVALATETAAGVRSLMSADWRHPRLAGLTWGAEDLAAGVLRTPLSPEVSFTDDPLRIMRAARFLARFDLSPAPELADAAAEYAPRLAIVSVERVADELERLLAVPEPGPGLRFLADINALPIQTVDPAPTAAQVELAVRLAATLDHPVARRAGLLWPSHRQVPADKMLKRLRYSRADTVRTTGLVAAVDRAVGSPVDSTANSTGNSTANRAVGAGVVADSASPATVRAVAARIGVDDLPLLTALLDAITEHHPADSGPGLTWDAARARAFVKLVEEVSAGEDLSDLGSPLSGQAIVDQLGIEPGPIIGEAQKHLAALRIEHGPISHQEARALLADWWRQRQPVE